MTPDEIRQVYEAGPEAVVALVTALLTHHQRQIATLCGHNGRRARAGPRPAPSAGPRH